VLVAVRVTVRVLVGTTGVLVAVFTGVAEGVMEPQAAWVNVSSFPDVGSPPPPLQKY
jgi:hypothetical protein